MPGALPRSGTRNSTGDALAIKHYAQLTIAQVCDRLDGLSLRELQQLRQFEAQNGNRKAMLRALDQHIARAARWSDQTQP